MEKINLGAYQNSYYGGTAYHVRQQSGQRPADGGIGEAANYERSASAKETGKTQSSDPVKLSGKAQELLKELQRKYGNMNFLIGDYSSEEEAQRILSRHTDKEFSVLIDPETLEKMAADKKERAKYEGVLSDAVGQLTSIREQLGSDGDKVKSLGVSIGSDGKASFFAEMEKASAKQREIMDEKRAARKEEAARQTDRAKEQERQEKLKAGKSTGYISADSAEELMEKIRLRRFDEKKEEVTTGKNFDFSV